MFILIGLAVLAVYGLLVFYIGFSGWRWMKPRVPGWFKIVYAVVLGFLAVSFFVGRFVPQADVLGIIGSYWLAVFSLLLMILPVVHLTLLVLRLTALPRQTARKWAGLLTLAALVGIMVYGSYNAYNPVIREYDIRIPKTVEGMEQLNVVMASDMHFGLLSGRSHAERMVKEINRLNPDLVLFPGDIIDDDLNAYVRRGFGGILKQVEAKYGVYATLGNHDTNPGAMDELITALEDSAMRVLYDESVVVDNRITLVGRKDKTDRDRATLEELLRGTDKNLPLILLDHQPYELDIAKDNGIDLMVSGHTHRGQIAPAQFITRRIYENDWGHLIKGDFDSVVSSGYGFWGPPIRTGSRAEIVQLHIMFTGGQ
ncbi:metallophosphoesterase [Paenibacillus sp. YN15]|uniref:metallophosphoesterase n=1 Tax=Paenibacillus sp. YN15 TaxID=1742774 RepID=UPI000DCE1743|nr:metallophosphoesterase [Paenibacillus sp. YN15]RAU98668.1 metallophosphoesterase [Paenibacillus sp. YN15]